jgi:hypothetical protein
MTLHQGRSFRGRFFWGGVSGRREKRRPCQGAVSAFGLRTQQRVAAVSRLVSRTVREVRFA